MEKLGPVTTDVGLLSRSAIAHMAKEEFTEGFALLELAQERAASDGYRLDSGEAVDFGNALAAAGHTFYNFMVDIHGQVFDRTPAIGLEREGEVKFHQAAEVFKYAVEEDPTNAQAYSGLSAMQLELGQRDSAKQTLVQLESILKEDPSQQTFEMRLAITRRYQWLEDRSSAFRSYGQAIEQTVGTHPFRRLKIIDGLVEYINKLDGIEPDELQHVAGACRRATLLDPSNKLYRTFLAQLEKISADTNSAAVA